VPLLSYDEIPIAIDVALLDRLADYIALRNYKHK